MFFAGFLRPSDARLRAALDEGVRAATLLAAEGAARPAPPAAAPGRHAALPPRARRFTARPAAPVAAGSPRA